MNAFYVCCTQALSWAGFYLLGKLYFNTCFSIESGSSRKSDYQYQYMHTSKYQEYHQHIMHHNTTQGQGIGSVTKCLFIASFVVSLSLLELTCIDILRVSHLSEYLWGVNLLALCVILNGLTPFVFVRELCHSHWGFTDMHSSCLAGIVVIVIQVGTWTINIRPDAYLAGETVLGSLFDVV